MPQTNSTSWSISGPVGYSGSGGPSGGCVGWYTTATAGTYTISAPSISGYSGPTYPGGQTQNVSAGNTTTFYIDYTATPVSASLKCNGNSGSCTVNYNDSASLNWTSANASSCTLYRAGSGVSNGTSGSYNTGAMTTTTYFEVDCNGTNGGSASSGLTVYVNPPPVPTATITCNDHSSCTTGYGTTVNLAWSSTNATSCSILPGGWSGTSGSATPIETSNTTYTLTCNGLGGQRAQNTANVTVSGPTVSLSVSPSSLNWDNSGSTLTWSSTNAASCTASGGWSGSRKTSGSESTGVLTPGNHTYTLTCTGNGSSNDSKTVSVTVPTVTATNVSETEPNYCQTGPGGTVSWTYSDQANSPQEAYEVQVTNTGSFNNPIYDSGKITNAGQSASLQSAGLQFNTTYKARVMVWDSYNVASSWSNATSSWKTPSYAYPQVDFTWTPTSPQKGTSVPFTDNTTFSDGKTNGHQWSWTFGDGSNSTNQNPTHAYTTDNTYTVTLSATDNANQSCSLSKTINVQKPIPQIKEVAP